jgi:hypothetical protein
MGASVKLLHEGCSKRYDIICRYVLVHLTTCPLGPKNDGSLKQEAATTECLKMVLFSVRILVHLEAKLARWWRASSFQGWHCLSFAS